MERPIEILTLEDLKNTRQAIMGYRLIGFLLRTSVSSFLGDLINICPALSFHEEQIWRILELLLAYSNKIEENTVNTTNVILSKLQNNIEILEEKKN